MKSIRLAAILSLNALLAAALLAADEESWSKAIKSNAERGTLEVRAENVRGDIGKWRDTALLQVAPALVPKPGKLTLDDWADQMLQAKANPDTSGDTWLVFRTRQFDDNDRAWVEKIERKGNRFTVVMHQAVWKGYYGKSFTYYRVIALNLGKLPAGNYEATWVTQPLSFTTFEDAKKIQTSASKDEQPVAGRKGEKLKHDLSFKVASP